MKIDTEELYGWLRDDGAEVDIGHHTRSRHIYDEDGIAINRGDWLINEWTGRKGTKPHPTSLYRLRILLDKQARLEVHGGWTSDHLVLKYYLLEYFYSSICFKITRDRLDKLIDDVVDNTLSPLCRNDNDIRHHMTDKGGKVDVNPSVTDTGERCRLQKLGERKFNDFWIGKMVAEEPGRTAYYYERKSREWGWPVNGKGWSKDTIKDFLRRKGIDE